MALIHRATVTPSKLRLLATWLPSRPWYAAADGELTQVAAYRFDDPADEVGIETLLVRVGDGPVHQVPLTYRGAPLAGADDLLVGTTEHSALGTRWVYDGVGDPVYVAALASAILANTGQADQYFEVDGRREFRALTMSIACDTNGSTVPDIGAIQRVDGGDPTRIVTDTVELTVARRLGNGLTGTVLTGAWQDHEAPLAAATVR